MFKITLAGMKGRKKDSFLLCFVILLSFIFVVTSTTIYSSSEFTKQEEKIKKYGTWRSVYRSNALTDDEEKFIKENLNDNRIYSFSESTVGKVGSLPKDFINMAHFQLLEGRLPEAMDEIVIEYDQLDNFNSEVKIGDQVPIRITIPFANISSHNAELNAVQFYIKNHISEIYDFAKTYPKHSVSDFIQNYDRYFFENKLMDYVDPLDDDSLFAFLSIYNIEVKEKLLQENIKLDLATQYGSTKTLNIFSADLMDNMRIETTDKVKYTEFSPFDWNNIGNFEGKNTMLTENDKSNRSVPFYKEVSIIIPLKVTGFIANYTDHWAGGDQFPNAFVNETTFKKLQEGFYKQSKIDVSEYQFESLIINNTLEFDSFLKGLKSKDQTKNLFMYPEIPSKTDATLAIGTIILIGIATIASVFQISLTQLKRKTRKLVLLKSIGAVKKQIYQLLIFELLILFIISLPLGLIFGLGLSYGVIHIMNAAFNISLNFHIQFGLLVLGLLLSIVAVILGMLVPVLKSVNVPLVGAMTEPIRATKSIKSKGGYKANRRPRKLNFSNISLTQFKSDRKKNILTSALYTVAISALLSTVVLSYLSFTPYIDEVIIKDIPDFSVEMIHGLGRKDMKALKNEIKAVEGVADLNVFRYGKNGFMYHDTLFSYKPFSERPKKRAYKPFVNIDENNDYLIRKACLVDTYAIEATDSVYEKIMKLEAVKDLNVAAFESGEEVILLLPSYTDSDMSMSFKNSSFYNQEYAIEVGDSFQLTLPTENRIDDFYTNDVNFNELKVGAIIHSFESESIWPFSNFTDFPIILTSYDSLGSLYKKSFNTPNMEPKQFKNLILGLEPTKNGRTTFAIYTTPKANKLQIESELNKVLKKYGVKPNRNFVENEVIFNRSLKLAMIVLIFGFAITLIALMILYNTNLSKIEGERNRLGILQALGVTHRQFKKLYLLCGIFFGLFSLFVGLFLAFSLLTLGTGGASKVIDSRFGLWWLFPWEILFFISGIFVFISIFIYYVPIKGALKNNPIHNIQCNQN